MCIYMRCYYHSCRHIIDVKVMKCAGINSLNTKTIEKSNNFGSIFGLHKITTDRVPKK